ncbi:YezD family protein [Patescibacteria group bacterium]|nr:YezD family protein [Patescibacteria group bacterium]MBU2036420.1 YezD family protein [Patescibacteria group bacterium]
MKKQYKNGDGLVSEIISSLKDLNGWGSLEIFVQDHKVTQITKREINKTNHSLNSFDDK